ncbi:competence protein CoiA [Neobacillus ginsengisoli]|uniref:Competence protein CoiA n=1 Tax=Neobacillus ginsengisoli TaxID=904295 RepID=A0ABT9XTB4_9BACI|nr:competence protein CoiA family protein [Neobacillus ginsengisoli]MDQ0198194.1 competence protein CoiA [Neobacillus ginsengisoli]
MLTANTKSGTRVCLGYDYKKETLLKLRSKEDFFCPECGERVSLKLGDQRIYHFAHKRGSMCGDFYERESVYHMEGKRQLFQWLINQKINAHLEYYDREIHQRPDIMFFYNGKKYALEFQCSTIPEKEFIKRTNTYCQNGYIPLWIISDNHFKQKERNVLSLSNFQFFFLRKTFDGVFYIPSYCPEKRSFHLVGSVISFSVKKALVQSSHYQINHIKIWDLLNPKILKQVRLDQWSAEIEKFNFYWSMHPSPKKNSFLHEVYIQNLNLFLLPPEIGLPVHHSIFIETSPTIWQTYLYIDVLSKKNPKEKISIEEVEFHFKKRLSRKEVIIRKLPQLDGMRPFVAVNEYLLLLVKLGILTRKTGTLFELQRHLSKSKTNREKEEKKQEFYQKYHHILSKI